MRARLGEVAVRDIRFWPRRMPDGVDGTLALDLGKLHDPVSIFGWGLAVIGGLTIWTALFVAI